MLWFLYKGLKQVVQIFLPRLSPSSFKGSDTIHHLVHPGQITALISWPIYQSELEHFSSRNRQLRGKTSLFFMPSVLN